MNTSNNSLTTHPVAAHQLDDEFQGFAIAHPQFSRARMAVWS